MRVGVVAAVLVVALVAGAIALSGILAGAPLPLPTAGSSGQTVYAVGDMAGRDGRGSAVADMIGNRNFDALITLGDHAYEHGSLEEFEAFYRPTFGRFDDRVYPSPGNHDYATDGAAGYFTYFGERARNFPDRPYYAFTLGAWRVYSLNSEIDQALPGSDMYEWLRNDLARSSSPCIAAYWHKPMFTVGRKENDEGRMQLVWNLLAINGADIVLAGHDHNYQRWEPIDGMTSFVVGTGGRSRYPIERRDPRVAYATDSTYGALMLELGDRGARYEFVSDENRTLDAGELGCRSKGQPAADRPAAPTDVQVSLNGTEASLSWQPAAAGSNAVIGYLVYRGTTPIGFTEDPALVDDEFPPGSSVLYTVRAVDRYGIRSERSIAAHAGIERGFTDFQWAPLDENPSSPTADKPQSKLWYADETWWGILWATEVDGVSVPPSYYIHRFDRASQGWINTGTAVDERDRSHADALWSPDVGKLFVASASAGGAAKLYRYTFESGAYALDDGYPVRMTESGSESISIARDSTGVLWATLTQLPDGAGACVDGQECTVRVMHSLDRDYRWTPATTMTDGIVRPDDISAAVALGDGRIAVVWSNQLLGGFVAAIREDGDPDTAWSSETINVAPRASDDHINVKTDASGRLYMVVKTSLNDEANGSPDAPLVVVWIREPGGNWRSATAWETRDDVTRPQLVVDEKLEQIIVVAAQPGDGGAIVYKTASLADLSFDSGLGVPILVAGKINNPTTTKQSVSLQDGVLILAGDSPTRTYWHAIIRLDDADQPVPAP
ncbi:MAG TPA: metallophosphoesterase [Candidatus Limnocylindria bacterium]